MKVEAARESAEYPELDGFINSLAGKDGALIPVLHFAQKTYGHLSTDVQLHIAHRLNIPAAKVYGVVTFYSLFSMEEKGRFKIKLCTGTACFVRGIEAVLTEFKKELSLDVDETTPDKMFTLETVRCVGACGLAPVVTVNDKVYGRVKPDDVKRIVDEYLGKE